MTADNIAALLIGIIVTFPLWMILAYFIKVMKNGVEKFIADRVRANSNNLTPATDIENMQREIQRLTDATNSTYNSQRDTTIGLERALDSVTEALKGVDDLSEISVNIIDNHKLLQKKYDNLEKKYDQLEEKIQLIISI